MLFKNLPQMIAAAIGFAALGGAFAADAGLDRNMLICAAGIIAAILSLGWK